VAAALFPETKTVNTLDGIAREGLQFPAIRHEHESSTFRRQSNGGSGGTSLHRSRNSAALVHRC